MYRPRASRRAIPDGGSESRELLDRLQEELQLLAAVGERVLDARRARVEDAALEDAGGLQVSKAGGERPRWDAADRLEKLVEPRGPGVGRVEDRDGPAPLEEVRRSADLLGDGSALTTARRHRAPVRA